MMRKTSIVLFALVLMVTFTLSGCGGNTQPSNQTQNGTGTNNTSDTFVVAMPSTPPTLDNEFVIHPMVISVQPLLYDTMINYETKQDSQLGIGVADIFTPKFKQALAESWSVSDDGKKYTFQLRKGVKSNYGNEMTADDVVWTYQRKLTLGGNSMMNMNLAGLQEPSQVKKIDNYTVEVNLKQASPLFEHVHTLFFSNSVWDTTEVKKHVTSEDPWAKDWLSKNSAGFGPYYVEKFTSGQEMILAANPNYYGEKPFFKKIIWKEVPQSSNRLALMINGAVDMAYGLNAKERQELKGKSDIKVQYHPSNNFMELAFNNQTKPFDNKELRKAIAYAIPYNDILKTVFYDEARLRKSIVPDIYPGYNGSYWKYETDLNKAKELLKQAGYENGVSFKIAIDVGEPEAEQVALLIKSNLEKINIKVDIDKLPSATFADKQGKRELPAFIWTEQPIYADMGFATWLWFHDENFPAWSEYKNPEMEKLFTENLFLKDKEKRTKGFDRVQQILMEDMPVIPIVERGWYVPMKSDIKGYTWFPDNSTRFQYMSR